MYVYDVNTDQWAQLPSSDHYLGIPCIVSGILTIIGGRSSATILNTKKVSSYDESSQTWVSYYPDLVSPRHRPGVVTHHEHVILAGGTIGIVKDDIEILNWIENSHWRIVSTKLPEPMWNFTPTIANGHLIIVGFVDARNIRSTNAYKISAADITTSTDQQRANSDKPTKWIKMANAISIFSALIPNTFPPMIVGGTDQSGTVPSSDIRINDGTGNSWRKVASLSSARSEITVASINDNAIIVFGGCTKGENQFASKVSCVSTVELGQAKSSKPTIIQF